MFKLCFKSINTILFILVISSVYADEANESVSGEGALLNSRPQISTKRSSNCESNPCYEEGYDDGYDEGYNDGKEGKPKQW